MGHHMYPIRKNNDIFGKINQTKRSVDRSPILESSGKKTSFDIKTVRKLAIEKPQEDS